MFGIHRSELYSQVYTGCTGGGNQQSGSPGNRTYVGSHASSSRVVRRPSSRSECDMADTNVSVNRKNKKYKFERTIILGFSERKKNGIQNFKNKIILKYPEI